MSAQITMTDITGSTMLPRPAILYVLPQIEKEDRGTERKEGKGLVQVCNWSVARLNIPEERGCEVHQAGACEHIRADLLDDSFLPAR